MSGSPKVRSMIVPSESESRPVLVSAANKAKVLPLGQKPASKVKKEEEKVKNGTNQESSALMSTLSAPSRILRRQEILLRSNFSMNASCSSDASTDSFCSRASTGRIGRVNYGARKKQGVGKIGRIVSKLEKVVSDGEAKESIFPDFWQGKRRCAWVTLNTDPCYAAFHDEEWGVPVHDDKKLFELLVLSGALAELAWPSILSKRHIFREVFMDFDPVAVSNLNEKRIIASGSTANSLLSEPKLRGIIENGRQMLKIIEEFGSFDKYCWTFVNHKPITSKFRYARQIPVKTPKADMISKDLVRRGFRSVGPTVIYTFMQVAGLTNDHLIGCFRFEECAAAAAAAAAVTSSCNNSSSNQLCASIEKRQEDRINDIDLDLSCLTIS